MNDQYLSGNRIGIVLGSQIGVGDGQKARNLGSGDNPENSYREPADIAKCEVFEDYLGTISQNPVQARCTESEFFDGFGDGYETAYDWGFRAGYYLDQFATSPTQPPAQSPTQPPAQSPTQRLPPFEELEETLR